MISKSAIILSLSLPICFNVNADNHPTKNDIDTVFTTIVNDASLIDEDDLLRKENYRRLDESNDKEYYKSPRFTEHIDKDAVNSLIKLHDKLIKDTAISLYNDNNHMLSILDICASHVSHLPSTYNKEQAIKNNAVIVGIGMNNDELVANPALTSSYVIDLNESPTMLGIPDNTFDLVLLQLSIDYLIHPIDVLKEAGRVLKTNGRIVISFSNRLFFDKAISAWSGKADIDHIELVGRYLLATKKYGTPIAIDATVSKSNVDPLYAVTAIKL
jgi:SAM-dependent methyltransferase